MKKAWRKIADEEIKLVGGRIWINKSGNSDILHEYAFKKQLPVIEKYIDGSVCVMLIMMVREGCLPVR